jgi:hypothetical protein
MKLKAPPGVGDPCVAGVAIVARDGVYDVELEVGALLIECFGFAEIEPAIEPTCKSVAGRGTPRRKAPAKKA